LTQFIFRAAIVKGSHEFNLFLDGLI